MMREKVRRVETTNHEYCSFFERFFLKEHFH